FSSILYLANRYFGLIQFAIVVTLATDIWTPSACGRIFFFEPIGALISIVLSQMVLGGRVYAVFSQSKPLGFILASILIVELVVGGVAISHITHPPSIPIGAPGLPPDFQPPPCGALTGPFKWQVTYWTLPLFYDTLTFLLTAWKAYSFWRKELHTHLFNIIWRDGLLYFLAILIMNILNVVLFLAAPNGIRTINLPATIILEIILSCRLILNLKGTQSESTLHPNLLKTSNTLRVPEKSPKWSSSTGTMPSTSHSDSPPDINLEVYGEIPKSTKSVFNVKAAQQV
ncbi:hypothetical protein CVT25_002019, partial [Psilocybe cyanescens]